MSFLKLSVNVFTVWCGLGGSQLELLLKYRPSVGGVSPKWDFSLTLLLKLFMFSNISFLLSFSGVGMKFKLYPKSLYSIFVKPSPDRFTTCPKGSEEYLVELLTCSRILLWRP